MQMDTILHSIAGQAQWARWTGFSGAVFTPTGFLGQARVDVRHLVSATGANYSPDLVCGYTTHVICATRASSSPGDRSLKPGKALEWGLPLVHLNWLLHSVSALEVLPIEPYLLGPTSAAAEHDDEAEQVQEQQYQQQHVETAPGGHAGAALHKRPSSVASNLVPGPGAARLQQPSPQQQQQQDARRAAARLALAPLEPNAALAAQLCDRLRSVSISPERAKLMAARSRQPSSSGSEVKQVQQEDMQQQCHHWASLAGQRQEQQHSPTSGGSSQHSLSLQDIVQRQSSSSPVGVDKGGSGERMSAGTHLPQPSPMSISVAGSPAEVGQRWPETEQPFAFSLAAALASPLSPMSPTLVLAAPGSSRRDAEPMSVQQQWGSADWRSGGLCSTRHSPLGSCSALAPLRGLSDSTEAMQLGGNLAGGRPGGSDTNWLSQTPQVIEDALLLTAPPHAQLPAGMPTASPLRDAAATPAGRQAASQAGAGAMPVRMPAVVQDWTDDDDDAVAPDQPYDIVLESKGEEKQKATAGLEQQQRQHLRRQQQIGTDPGGQEAAATVDQQRQHQYQRPDPEDHGTPGAAVAEQVVATVEQPSNSSTVPDSEEEKEWEAPRQPRQQHQETTPDRQQQQQQQTLHKWCRAAAAPDREEEQVRHEPSTSSRSSPTATLSPAGSDGEPAGAMAADMPEPASPLVDLHDLDEGPRSQNVASHCRRSSPGQQQQQRLSQRVADWSEDDDSGDEVPSPGAARPYTGLTQLDPARIKVARPKAAGPPWSAAAATAAAGTPDVHGTTALRVLLRPPRGSCVKERHGLRRLTDVQFAESVQLADGSTLSTKDKKTVVLLPAAVLGDVEGGGTDSSAAVDSEDDQVLAEPATFYRLAGGAWQLECYRFFNVKQAEALAAAHRARLALPPDFDRRAELLRATERSGAALADVAGTTLVRKVKAAPGAGMLQLRGGGRGSARPAERFWRFALDVQSMRILTDASAAAFVLD